MPDMQEVYDMITKQTPPRIDPLGDQHRRQRRHQRRRAIGAYTVTALILIGVVVAVATLRSPSTTQPAASDTAPLVGATNLIAYDVASGTPNVAIADVGAFGAAVSPDGTRIAFVRSVAGHPAIFVASIDGSNVTQITGLADQPGCVCGSINPSWAPDGQQIVFEGTSESGDHRIETVDLRSGETRTVANGANWDTAPDWSADGTQLAYASGLWDAEPAGSGKISSLGLREGAPTLLVARRAGASQPDWSTQGPQIAFTADVPGGTALFMTTGDAGVATSRRLTDGTDDSAPAFSPDGTQIAFVRNGAVSILDLATGDVRTLGPGEDPAWSPDGATIYAWHAS
jgi:Tol biopolymer transport system component